MSSPVSAKGGLSITLLGIAWCLGLWFVSVARSQNPPSTETTPAASKGLSDETEEWIERDVRPLVAERCLSCHSSSLDQPKGGLKLDRHEFLLDGGDSGPAIDLKNPEQSLLVKAIRRDGLQMPPDKPLSSSEVNTLVRWVKLGAPLPRRTVQGIATGETWLKERASLHWAWQLPREYTPPQVRSKDSVAGPIDAFVQAKLEEKSLQPSGRAEPHVLGRRLSYDLLGLPASRELVERLSIDSSRESISKIIDDLLASPQFGVTWGRHWLDLVRFSETLGHEFDYPIRHAYRYRDAVVDAWNIDLPYSTFVKEHIAGDSENAPRRHPRTGEDLSRTLTGWWWMGDGMHAPVDVLGDEAGRVDNQIDVYSKTFLGLTLSCARCHDHKFDALSLNDYTSFVGLMQSSHRIYALDDPNRQIATANQRLEALLADTERRLRIACASCDESEYSQRCLAWIDQALPKIAEKKDTWNATLPQSHPLYLLRVLAESTSQEDWKGRMQQIQKELTSLKRSFLDWEQKSVIIADFRQGFPKGWVLETPDPKRSFEEPAGVEFDWLSHLDPMPMRGGVFASHKLGRRQEMTLRSPTFELTHPVVALKIRGKSVQTSVVVDNYFMNEFQGLLFGDMRKPLDQSHDAGWIAHKGDLSKYLGHPAFLSLDDDENAWFELEQVRLADAPPPTQPSNASLHCLELDSGSSTELKQKLVEAMSGAWMRCMPNDEPRSMKASKDDRELIRAVVMESERLGIRSPFVTVDSQQVKEAASAIPAAHRIIAMQEGTPRNARQAIRGNPRQLGDPIARAELQALGGKVFASESASGRRELAENLVSQHHPLTARVFVNRVWAHLFGQGLCDTPDNLGVLGGAPSHPELLDYLTLQFMAHDWSLKWLVREICLSEAYLRNSFPTPEQLVDDPNGRLLSHRTVRRLTAEKVRDTLVSLAGSVDLAIGGESVPVHLTDKMTGRGRPGKSGPLDGIGRRAMFIEVRRNFLDPFLVAFDQPQPATTVGKRNISNVPAQSLGILNDPLVHEMAKRWAQRLQYGSVQPVGNGTAQGQPPANAAVDQVVSARIQRMFLDAYARQPSQAELDDSIHWLTSEGRSAEIPDQQWIDFAHVLLCAKELIFLR